MDLILWRHAQAHLQAEGQSDLERSLTGKGRRQAKLMAAWLNQRLAHSTRVLVSPALRTIETANALGRKFRISESLNPQAGVDDLLTAAR
jgi:phosphohistidine phosphatase